jgi:hypothetical protein
MKRNIPIITLLMVAGLFTSLLTTSCSQRKDRFRLEARFKNLNQGEFYIYDQTTGQKDTVAVNDGRFVYERRLTDTLTLAILFPNYSEIPVFASPGVDVKMEGDASHLRDTEITGSTDNDLMTAFRHKTAEMTPPDVLKEAEAFINKHPDSPVSNYLLHHFILQTYDADYKKAYQLCTAMHDAQPANQQLSRLLTLLEGLKNYSTDGELPPFHAIATNGDTVSNATLTGEANVIVVWATWNYDSQTAIHTLRPLCKEYGKRLRVMSVSVDAHPVEVNKILERDSITWPNVCDSMLWQSPLLAQLGVGWIPANIITDRQGHIVARNIKATDLKEKIKKQLSGN